MNLIVQPAPTCLGVDVNTPVTEAMLAALAATEVNGRKVEGIGRYVALHTPEALTDLSIVELLRITSNRMGVWIVQHCHYPNWTASAQLGADMGGAAVLNAQQIGVPPGSTLFFDAEGVANPGPAMVQCLQAWAMEVVKHFGPGEYCGYDNGETPEQHYSSQPNVHLYWKAPGPWSVATRGFAMAQGETITIGGQEYDPDDIGQDLLGGRLQWIVDPGNMPLCTG